jgi:hypothetical protein
MNIKGMASQYDHDLTLEGIQHVIAFNSRWKAETTSRNVSENADDVNSFLSAQAVFAFPLTRATQTALLTLEDHAFLQATSY